MLKFLVVSVAVIWALMLTMIVIAFVHGKLKRHRIYDSIASRFRRLSSSATEAERRIRSCDLAHPNTPQNLIQGGESIPYHSLFSITIPKVTHTSEESLAAVPVEPQSKNRVSKHKQSKRSKFNLSEDDE